MGIEVIILDFDGTLTNVEEEAGPGVDGWRDAVGKELKLTFNEIKERWDAAQKRILNNPLEYGWLMGNKIVAPAYADPWVLARVTTELLFDDAGVHTDRAERESILQNHFFKPNYQKSITVFMPGANEFLTSLRKEFQVYIVTNSGVDGVLTKIQQLPSDHSKIPVYGDAKKYVLDENWEEVPESIHKEGFGRPLFLRRKRYGEVLDRIMRESNVSPERVGAVGDILELDLILPDHLGMHTILIPRKSTPNFELEAVRSWRHGYVADTLGAALTYLKTKK